MSNYIYIARDNVTGFTGILIDKGCGSLTVVNPNKVPNVSNVNFFFTFNQGPMEDMIADYSFSEVPGGEDVNLTDYVSFNNKLIAVCGNMISTRNTNQKRQWMEHMALYNTELYDLDYEKRFDFLEKLGPVVTSPELAAKIDFEKSIEENFELLGITEK